MNEKAISLPRKMQYAWSKDKKVVVEVVKRGHFPNTVMVKFPDNHEIEVEIDTLEGAYDVSR